MNSRLFKTAAAVLLAVGLSTVSVAAPASAAILKKVTCLHHQGHRLGLSRTRAPLRVGQLSGADSVSRLPIA